MLKHCPECDNSVSDKALTCPKCGYPLNQSQPKQYKRSNRRMRLPNGFGRITEIKGQNLRKPFRAMITDGTDENGRPIGRLLKPESYFATYNEAYQALMKYHQNPYDFGNDLTMSELYERWIEKHSSGLTPKRLRDLKGAWKYCSLIYETKVQMLKTRDVKNVLENATRIDDKGNAVKPTANIVNRMKSVISMMLDYAVEFEIVPHNCVKDIKYNQKATVQKGHRAFTNEEMDELWDLSKDNRTARILLINCYTGLRPSELCNIEVSKVNLTEWSMVGGMKTDAGRNRTVPIHERIRGFVRDEYNQAIKEGRDYLLGLTYAQYAALLPEITTHTPHDCRKSFVTMAKNAGVDEYAIKRIVGHNISDITESVYTERNITWLHKELAKIP